MLRPLSSGADGAKLGPKSEMELIVPLVKVNVDISTHTDVITPEVPQFGLKRSGCRIYCG